MNTTKNKNTKNNTKNYKNTKNNTKNHMRNIYIPELSNIDINNINMFLHKQINKKIFLGFNGFYEYINNVLFKFKINTGDDDKIEKINNTNIYCTKKGIIKFESVNQIPYEHETKHIQKNIYKTSNDSKNKFVVELIDKKVCDYYFESNEEFENKSLQEDIITFLSKLK